MPQMPFASEGVFFAALSAEQKQDVLNRVGKLAAQRFDTYRKAIREAFNLRELTSQGRLEMYRARTAEEWAAKAEAFPDEYMSQLQDYFVMEQRTKQFARQAGAAASPSTLPINIGGENVAS